MRSHRNLKKKGKFVNEKRGESQIYMPQIHRAVTNTHESVYLCMDCMCRGVFVSLSMCLCLGEHMDHIPVFASVSVSLSVSASISVSVSVSVCVCLGEHMNHIPAHTARTAFHLFSSTDSPLFSLTDFLFFF